MNVLDNANRLTHDQKSRAWDLLRIGVEDVIQNTENLESQSFAVSVSRIIERTAENVLRESYEDDLGGQ